MVGDSFSFGLGIENGQTFVHHLNELGDGKNVYWNFSIPGYSTDQEYLLIRERLGFFNPDVVVLVRRIQEAAAGYGAELKMVLLPGRSFVVAPDGISAQYQDYLRGRILAAMAASQSVTVIDLASYLRNAHHRRDERWFFPNEGHLTPEGHRVVAGFLAKALVSTPYPDQD